MSGGKPIVLYIEDNVAMRQAVRDYLVRACDVDVVEAENGQQGLDFAIKMAPNLVIIDLMLPDMHGLEVCRRLRKHPRTQEVTIIIMSVDPNQTAVDAAQAAGATSYVPKTGDFLAKLARQIRRLPKSQPSLIDSRTTSEFAAAAAAYADIGKLFQRKPEDIVPFLKNRPQNQWATSLATMLLEKSMIGRGLAVIALAAWQRQPSAPFNKTQGQRYFWEYVRHSLASSTAADAIAVWGRIAPLAQALMYPLEQIGRALEVCARSRNIECRQWALRLLLEDGDPLAIELAVEALSDGNDDVRATAAITLGSLGAIEHVPLLTHSLNDYAPFVREQAALALARINAGNMGMIALSTALLKGSPEAAEAAANALSVLDVSVALQPLIEAAETRREPSVLCQIVHAFGKFQNNKSRLILLKLRNHPDESVRQTARFYLGG
jgi:CheY-like chemotaxis protein